MIDLGTVKGQHVFYTGGRSLKELIESGEVVALPDYVEGIIFKRVEMCTQLEMNAQLTLDEIYAIYEKLGRKP